MSFIKSSIDFKNQNSCPKVLLISALPITKSASTRAFYTYFKNIPSENIAQIYTNTANPTDFNLCKNFLQITDARLLKRRFSKNVKVEQQFKQLINDSASISKSHSLMISFGKKDYSLVDLLRDRVWKTRYFLNKETKTWIEEFNPDLIFYHNSNALFMEKMCLEIYKYCKKPVLLEVSDDYLFGKKFSLSPFRLIRKIIYKKRFRKIIGLSSNQIYVSDKMERKYNKYFSKNGKTVHISSELSVSSKSGGEKSLKIGYFGNTGLGRLKPLLEISEGIKSISKDLSIDVYCPRLGNSKEGKKEENLNYCGFLSYDKMIEKMKEYDLLLFVESSKKKYLSQTEYSLSTKIADYLSCGVPIFAYGPSNSGSISYLRENDCAVVCDKKTTLIDLLSKALDDVETRENAVNKGKRVFERDFNLERNSNLSFSIISNIVKKE